MNLRRKLKDRMVLLFKLYFDRRTSRGGGEFSFRWYWDKFFHKIRVRDKRSNFEALLSLRPNTSDIYVFEQVFANCDYSLRRLSRYKDIAAIYEEIVSQSYRPIVLDLGANIGMASLYFGRDWPQAWIAAVEPDQENFDILRRNVSGYDIQPFHAAVASADGKVSIITPGADSWAKQTTIDSGGSVRAMSISSLLAHAPKGATPFICKIDIEGFEAELFSKNLEWIASFPVIVIELHDWMMPGTANSRNFLKAIALHDRDFVFHGENVFSIRNKYKT